MRQCRCRDRYDYVGVDMCGDVDVERDRCDYVGVDYVRRCRCRDRCEYVGVDYVRRCRCRDRCDYVGVDMCGDVDVETGAIM